MKQTDLFNKAIVAKLSGNEEAFKTAISEAIKAKAKAMLGESRQGIKENAQHKGPGVEEVDKNWYYVYQPFNLPEGNVANLPAGPYVASFNIGLHPRFGDSPQVLEVEVCHPDDDQVLTSLYGEQGEAFYSQYIPQETRRWIDNVAQNHLDDQGESQEQDRLADIGADRSWERQTNMDGKDHPF